MEGHAEKCVEKVLQTGLQRLSIAAGGKALSRRRTATIEANSHQYASRTCLHLGRVGRPHSLWKVNILASSVTEWNKAQFPGGILALRFGNLFTTLKSWEESRCVSAAGVILTLTITCHLSCLTMFLRVSPVVNYQLSCSFLATAEQSHRASKSRFATGFSHTSC